MSIPKWFNEIITEYGRHIYRTFFIYGNIGDYASDRIFLKDFLVGQFKSCEQTFFRKNRVFLYDINSGGTEIFSGQSGLELNEIIKEMNKRDGNSAFIFYYPEFIIPDGNYIEPNDKKNVVALHNVLNSSSYIISNNITVFVTESLSGINPMFLGNNSKCSMKNIELPDLDSRMEFITNLMLKQKDNMDRMQWKDMTIPLLAKLTSGLQNVAIEDILLYACYEGYIIAIYS